MAVSGRKRGNVKSDATAAAVRLFVGLQLREGAVHRCTTTQANYLVHVLRLGEGAEILLFNGADGEWRARIAEARKGQCTLEALEQTRSQTGGPDLHYLFAPLKRARLDYMVQKATEMGVSTLRPVITARTNVARVNLDRMRANAIEAAEQCGVLRVPSVHAPQKLEAVLSGWDASRRLVYCDEGAEVSPPLDTLARCAPGPLALLIGPEGGFDEAERSLLRDLKFVIPLSLGPRVMRADTAAVAALALVNAVLGDWC